MELRTYWHILIRRWWLALIPAIVVLGIGLATYRQPAPVYQVGVRFTVGYAPESSATYLVRPLLSGVAGLGIHRRRVGRMGQDRRFCRRGEPRTAKAKRRHPGSALAGRVAADIKRSMVTMYITWGDARQLEAIATAAITVLQTRNAQAFPQLGPNGAIVRAVDPVNVGQRAAGLARSTRPADSRGAGAGAWALRSSSLRITFGRNAAPEICGRMTMKRET